MKQTLTNTVIPTFDIKRLQPIIFSTADVNFYPNNILYLYLILYSFFLFNIIIQN